MSEKKKDRMWLIPLAVALIAGIAIISYWITALHTQSSNRDLSGMPDYAGTLVIDDDFTVDVVQGKDNSYYLSHDGTGADNKYGCPFIDASWTPDTQNMVVYGHNSFNGTGFSGLVRFSEEDYRAEHKTFIFIDRDGKEHVYDLMLVLDYSTDYIRTHNPYSSSLPENYCDRMKKFISYGESLDIGPDDRIITLSTCDERIYGAAGRLIVVGKEQK